ncbi:MAG TPA: hypothetical protein VL123_09300 [Candidatus Udaeobacter sp.]|jgi:hypothetical protein|nr:hypothetical protein [Candidatus Udaeobacter sp.]
MFAHRGVVAGLVLLGLLAGVGAAAAQTADTNKPVTVGGSHVKRHAEPASMHATGGTKWSATTDEAAGTPEQKKTLASGRRATLTGEIVDASCYLQLGKRGAAHVDCGTKCANNGQPLGLLTKTHTLYLLFPEEHHPRRDGQAEIRSTIVPLMGKTVTVTGTSTMINGSRGLFLQHGDLENVKTVAVNP